MPPKLHIRNKCTKIRRENIRSYFENVTKNGTGSKRFWTTIKPYLSNKNTHGKEDYTLEEENELIRDPEKIANIFNEYYTNIVEYATGSSPIQIPLSNGDIIEDILSHYENHESIKYIKNMGHSKTFELPLAEEDIIESIIDKLDTSKATELTLFRRGL